MSDLISRSAVMKEIESLSMRITGLRAGKGVLVEVMNEYKKSVLRIIDEQPTAYDVEEVVQQFKKIAGCNTECAKTFYEGMGCEACMWNAMMLLIRQGGGKV